MIYAAITGTPKTKGIITLQATSQKIGPLKTGTRYLLISDTDVHLAAGDINVSADTNDTWILLAGAYFEYTVREDVGDYLAAIPMGGLSSGKVYVSEVVI